MAEQKPARHTKRKPERRGEILAAAVELFHRNGYSNTGMDEIGAATGITGPGIYRHFDSKEEILNELVEIAAKRAVANAQATVESASDAEAALDGLIDNYISTFIRNRALTGVFLRERRIVSGKVKTHLDSIERTHIKQWTHTLSRFRPGLSDRELRLMVHAAFGLIGYAAYYDSGMAPEAESKLLTGMMKAALSCEMSTQG